MPIGPKGERRPTDVIGNAVRVMEIATGQEDEIYGADGKNKAAQALGKKGGMARAAKLSAKRRKEIAQLAAQARYAQKKEK